MRIMGTTHLVMRIMGTTHLVVRIMGTTHLVMRIKGTTHAASVLGLVMARSSVLHPYSCTTTKLPPSILGLG